MDFLAGLPLTLLGDATAAMQTMRSFVMPLVSTLIAIGSVAVVFFLINGGYQYMASSGNPDKLENAKKIIRNALIGLVMIIAAATLTAILTHAYSGSHGSAGQAMPVLSIGDIPGPGVTDVLVKAIIGLLKTLIETAAAPFLSALSYFTESTPLMAENSGVFNLWLVMVGIADVLFILVVALLGFHVMSAATFGLQEMELRQLLPRIALAFLLVNSSIFIIDAIITLSNGMISAVQAGFSSTSVWDVLTGIVNLEGTQSLAGLLVMVVFLVLSVMLLVYYVLRLVTLYIGAVLAPIVMIIWLLPAFRDFVATAVKIYITTIFVLFIHVVILHLAASLLAGMVIATPGQEFNPLMSMIVGIATLLALLKTQGVLAQMSYMSLGPKTATRLGSQLVNAISHYSNKHSSRSTTHNSSKRPEGLSRGGIASVPSGNNKSMFNKSESVVVSRAGGAARHGANNTSTQNNSRVTNSITNSKSAATAPRTPTGQTHVAPPITPNTSRRTPAK